MDAKATITLAFLALVGCGGAGTNGRAGPVAAASKSTGSRVEVAEVEPPTVTPRQTLAEADRLYDSRLGATRAGQFEIDRQVAELRRAVLLYKQFIERAEAQPDMSAAVRKSRERIDDACGTIVFLLQDTAEPASDGC